MTTGLLEGVIANMPMFRQVARQNLADLARHARVQHVRRGGTVCRRGEWVTCFYGLAYGLVKLSLRADGGEEKVLRLVGPGETFGEALVFRERPNPLDAIALADTMLVVFPAPAVLALLEREGMAAVHARHALLARAVQAAVECWSQAGAVSLHCRVPEARSVSVTTINVRPGIDVEALRSVSRERFQVAFAGALGPQSGRAFRIGHLGDVNAPMILGCLAGVEAAMLVQRIPFGRNGVQKAVDCLASGRDPGAPQ